MRREKCGLSRGHTFSQEKEVDGGDFSAGKIQPLVPLQAANGTAVNRDLISNRKNDKI
jgi:hypothetical protein